MEENYRKYLGLAEDVHLVKTGSEWKQRRGQDTDFEYYEQHDAEGNVVAKYEIQDSTSMYPPQTRTVRYVKYGPDGKQIDSGELPTR